MKGTLQKVRRGGTPRRAPIGYLNVRKQHDGREVRTVALDPERAGLVPLGFQLYATGEYSLNSLLTELTKRGLTTRRTRTFPSRPLYVQNLNWILRNPYYMGKVTFQGVQYDGQHEALVSAATFEQVQAVLMAHNLAGERTRRHRHYLKGTVFCDLCESRMSLTLAKGRRTGGEWLYFFCNGRHKGSGCLQPYVLAEDVEQAVADHYETIQLDPKWVRLVREQLLEQLGKTQRRNAREAMRLETRLRGLRNEREKLMHAYYEGAVSLDLLKTEQGRINQAIGQAENGTRRHAVRVRAGGASYRASAVPCR